MTIADLPQVASPSENAKNKTWNLQRKVGNQKLNKQLMHLRHGPNSNSFLRRFSFQTKIFSRLKIKGVFYLNRAIIQISKPKVLVFSDNCLLGPYYRTGFEFLIGSNCNKHQVKLKAKARNSSRRDRLKMFQRLQQKEPRIESGHKD